VNGEPQEPTEGGPLWAMEGVGADASVTGRAHDDVLYAEPRRRRKPSAGLRTQRGDVLP
jgi:hypothetical protein